MVKIEKSLRAEVLKATGVGDDLSILSKEAKKKLQHIAAFAANEFDDPESRSIYFKVLNKAHKENTKASKLDLAWNITNAMEKYFELKQHGNRSRHNQ